MKAQASLQTYTIAASGARTFDYTGDSFWMVNTTGTLKVSFDDRGEMAMTSGIRFRLTGGDLFRRIRVTNPDTSSAVTFSFFAGVDLDLDSVSPVVFYKPSPTYLVGASYTVSKVADSVVLNTNLRTGKAISDTRSHVILSNSSATATDIILVKDSSGNTASYVLPASQIQLVTSDTIYLRLYSGAGGATLGIVGAQFFNYDS